MQQLLIDIPSHRDRCLSDTQGSPLFTPQGTALRHVVKEALISRIDNLLPHLNTQFTSVLPEPSTFLTDVGLSYLILSHLIARKAYISATYLLLQKTAATAHDVEALRALSKLLWFVYYFPLTEQELCFPRKRAYFP